MPLKLDVIANFIFYSSVSLTFIFLGASFEGIRWFTVVIGVVLILVTTYFDFFKELPTEFSTEKYNAQLSENLSKIAAVATALFYGLLVLEQFQIVKILVTSLILIATLVAWYFFNQIGDRPHE